MHWVECNLPIKKRFLIVATKFLLNLVLCCSISTVYNLRMCKKSTKRILMLTGNMLPLQELVQGFDQETAAVVMARLTSLKMEIEVCFLFCQ